MEYERPELPEYCDCTSMLWLHHGAGEVGDTSKPECDGAAYANIVPWWVSDVF